jgi:hypothetical protein
MSIMSEEYRLVNKKSNANLLGGMEIIATPR